MEGQFRTDKLDVLLVRSLREVKDLPENISQILIQKSGKEFSRIERQQLMYFCVARKLDLSRGVDLREIVTDGIGDSAFIASGGSQSMWQAAINIVNGKPITAFCRLRGVNNPETKVAGIGYKDLADAAEFSGFLAHEKRRNLDVGFFDLMSVYFGSGYPLSGIRWPYNPGNADVARADEVAGGLNSKMRMVTEGGFVLGSLGGFRDLLNPDKIDCQVFNGTRFLAYEEATRSGVAPTIENPLAGKYYPSSTSPSEANASDLKEQTQTHR